MEKERIRKLNPSQILINSFLIIITFGTIALMTPFATVNHRGCDFITALFTTTSAVAVTGLSVVDIGKEFTMFGQIVIMILIQLGGLGIMTFSSLIMMAIGKKISYNEKITLKEGLNQETLGGIMKFIRNIVKIVIVIEGIGAIILTICFLKEYSLWKAFYYGVFHSVSAFCNAGFSFYPDSLVKYQNDYLLNFTVAFLIIFGGIGFAVIQAILFYFKDVKNKINLTSKIAIKITMWLIVSGMIVFFFSEYSNPLTIRDMSLPHQILTSFFQSVTTRTAGFNTVDIGHLKPATIFLFYILMIIGASPGSTGGGIKTTTFGVILVSVLSTIKNRENIEIYNRTIPFEIAKRAATILVISISYISVITFAILIIEDKEISAVLFEVISAFATVGLSMGITSSLTDFSKMLIIVTMFIGRLGPLTVAIALSEEKIKTKYKYAEENINIG
jgi:trk system potassium uptake protein